MAANDATGPDRSTEGPVVRTAAGAVRGLREHGLAVFRGIPFAEPPVGAARFAAPRPVAAWDGTRDAFAFGPPPPQDLGVPGATGVLDAPEGDDWLTVNVWTPDADPAARRPVMVWIYGGAYKLGHSGSPGYDAHRIALAGDLVVVTLNYRLGMEGFAHIEGAPANRGLLDQVAALEWVRENIAAFGGDPGQVTVFGESAGAGSTASLLAMPRARGLFGRAIVQSLPGTFFSADLAQDIGVALAAEVGLRPTVADLAAVAPRELALAVSGLSTKMPQYVGRWGQAAPTVTPYSPVVDGDVLPVTPWEAVTSGAARDIDLLVGHTRDEFRLFMVMGGMLGRITDEQASGALRLFAPGGEAGERAYRAAYPGADAGELFERVQTDWLFTVPSLRLAEAQVAAGGRAHFYELTWSAPGNGGVLGACHGLDIPLLFGTYQADLGALLFMGAEVTPEVEVLSGRFREAWTAFARTGDPGWAPYDEKSRPTQLFDETPTVESYPQQRSAHLWKDQPFKPLPLLS
ncbi:carboxylesterase/lipase family protein [Streptomyces sp. NPDC087425]|uniref:carboxylesterase/lipase family protein n=1 Tax=Streptomyces sp. NPDC087425 TaxID=3365787 RepID=UPI003822DDCA